MLQELRLSPDPVGRTLAWRCFSAASSSLERTIDDELHTNAAPSGGGNGGSAGGGTGGLADPSDDSRRLTFTEFRKAMLNVAQALGVPVYLGGRQENKPASLHPFHMHHLLSSS